MQVEDSGKESTQHVDQGELGDNLPARDEKGRLLPGNTANPSGRPRGRNWSATLAELAETKVRGGGGKTRAEVILSNLLERAETDNNAASIIMDRIEGKPLQKSAHIHANSEGEILNASISFVDPMNTIDITPPPEELPESNE